MAYQPVRHNILNLPEPANWFGIVMRYKEPSTIEMHLSNRIDTTMTLYFGTPFYFSGPFWWEGFDLCIASLEDTIALLNLVPYNDKLKPEYIAETIRLFIWNTKLPQEHQSILLASSRVGVHNGAEHKHVHFALASKDEDRSIFFDASDKRIL